MKNDGYTTLEEAIRSVECDGYFAVTYDDDTAEVYFYDDEPPVWLICKDEDSGRYVVGI